MIHYQLVIVEFILLLEEGTQYHKGYRHVYPYNPENGIWDTLATTQALTVCRLV